MRTGIKDGSAWALDQLRDAIAAHDGQGVELSLIVAGVFGSDPAYLESLIALVGQDWHECHETVVQMLDQLRSPAAIDALIEMTWRVPAYLEWDGSRALARKAVHALGHLQDTRAAEALHILVRTGDEVIRDVAARQLARRAR